MNICKPIVLAACLLGAAACEDTPTTTPDTVSPDAAADTNKDVGTDSGVDAAADNGPDTSGPPCNAIKQEGCADTENCTYANEATSATCQAAGEKLYGQECAGLGDCAQGTCINLNDTGNYCYKFCKTELHCSGVTPGPGGKGLTGSCASLSNSAFDVCEIDVEYESCDLLAQDCADSAKGCYASDKPTPICLPAGTSPVGGDCEFVTDCAPGNRCVNTKCYKLCGDPSDCETTFAACSSVDQYGVGICEEQ